MTETTSSAAEVALIVGGGPGISASCARLFREHGFEVAVAARTPDKPALARLAADFGVRNYRCDAARPEDVGALFEAVTADLGSPRLVVHNIDGRVRDIFRKGLTEADPDMVRETLMNSAYSAYLVSREAVTRMRAHDPDQVSTRHRGTIILTNASAAKKGYPRSGAFAMACQAKSGLAESMARELMPEGIHVASVPIDAAIGWTQPDGSRAHRMAGTAEDDNMADPDQIAAMYLHLHRQHRSTWAFEVVLRPWTENW